MKLYVTYGSPYARLARIIVIEKALEDRVGNLRSGPSGWGGQRADNDSSSPTAVQFPNFVVTMR